MGQGDSFGAHVAKYIRVYYLAVIAYFGIFLFGYATAVSGAIVDSDIFMKSFNIMNADGTENIGRDTSISSNVVSFVQAGAFFGALGSAPVSAKLGRRWTLFGALCVTVVGIILTTVANSGTKGLHLIYGGRVLTGFGIGAISAVSPNLVGECSPKQIRGRTTGFFQIMVAIGVMIAYFVNYGVAENLTPGKAYWQIPFGIQLLPAGVMMFGLLTVKESPRWLASKGRSEEAIKVLAYYQREPTTSDAVMAEFAEIEASIDQERKAREGVNLRQAILAKGQWIRFVLAFVIFLLQQFCGQNSVNYYTPQIFEAIGYTGTTAKLLASGIYGVVKVTATTLFVFFGVEFLGRKLSLFIASLMMGVLFFIVGALEKVYPPSTTAANPAPASKGMAACIYIYVCFYSMGWGPVPWVYCSEIFNNSTRHIGLAVASATQWLFNFVIAKITPTMVDNLGWKLFMTFATIDIGGGAVFAALMPETKGKSLEEMDILFGSVTAEEREKEIQQKTKELEAADVQRHHEDGSVMQDSVERKV
ncbi:general substrate transporter [Fistulina hepatica ATCC 64428]|uniref:General substrate transporter n=1 Tax=Fistulina hepatica ATCC 64428 TaxID=1128425 RepID=A0A0D7A9D3_9AGAR|nr:general substrate transporter [Fistulina hepatica ATCC 64428]